jgi:group I intron endonuclease
MAEATIYCITNIVNGKRYVGQTRQRLSIRWQGHRDRALGKSGQSYKARSAIGKAMRKYGVDCFVLSVLEICVSADELNDREAHWIAQLGTLAPYGYNLLTGANTAPRTDETKAKLRAAWVIRKQENRQTQTFKGRKHTAETKAKLSAAAKGRPGPQTAIPLSEDTKAKIRAWWVTRRQENRPGSFKGHKHTAESKIKMSAAKRGNKHALGLLRSGARRGPCPLERRAKISATLKGRRLSLETCAKIAATLKGRKRGSMSERSEKANTHAGKSDQHELNRIQ